MATERILKPDGYLDVPIDNSSSSGTSSKTSKAIEADEETIETRSIVYHPNLNVILVFDSLNHVKILDVHSGVVLHHYHFESNTNVDGYFMPLQEKILLTDGRVLGFRGDYNGVLLLDTVLQTPVPNNDDCIQLEMLLSEAILFQTCLKDLEQDIECPYDLQNELMEKIRNAQSNSKKGIKAQRWNTICLQVPYSSLKFVANNLVIMLKRLERHVPALAIASAINERLIDLLAGGRNSDISWHCNNMQRVLMHSEAVRRQTFEKWPHMDYKWALPDQMAQAGFYHQPSSSGEDRAMCFTCNVCLVCWEKTDEPWSEHERHSPMCPFVKGEYTQNVPLAVTYATNPAVGSPGALGFDVVSNSDYANVLCTSCTQTGDVTIWSIERHLKQMHCFNISSLMKEILGGGGGVGNAGGGDHGTEDADSSYEWTRVTAMCVLPNARAQYKIYAMNFTQAGSTCLASGVAAVSGNLPPPTVTPCTSTSTMRAGVVGSKIILGLSTRKTTGEHLLTMAVVNIVESDKPTSENNRSKTENMLNAGGLGTTLNTNLDNNNKQTSASNSVKASGDPSSSTETHLNKKYHDERDEKSQCTIFDKYSDGIDSNGFVADIVAASTPDPGTSVEKSDSPMDYNDAYLEGEFKKMAEQFNDLYHLFDYNYGQPVESSSISGVGGSSGPSVAPEDMEMDINYFKENLLAAAKNVQKPKPALTNDSAKTNNSPNPEPGSSSAPKVSISEDIDCIVESCCVLKRTNGLKQDGAVSGGAEEELVEIAEIIPTNSNCNQLLVKLVKTKVHPTSRTASNNNKMIITEVLNTECAGHEECHDDDYTMNEECQSSKSVGGQLLLFDCINGVIPNEHKMAMTFNRENYPKQICMLPNFQNITMPTESILQSNVCNTNPNAGAFCVVCADGSIEIFSLADFQRISTIKEEEHHFVSVAYCRSLERLCCCTRRGSLIFYSLNDSDNESGDEMIDMEEETCPTLVVSSNEMGSSERCVTDGVTPQQQNEQQLSFGGETSSTPESGNGQKCNIPVALITSIKVDCGPSSMQSSGGICQSSPSPSSTSMNSATSNLLAYRSGDLSLDDLRTLYSLTQFDEKVVLYTAEVPSCWNDLVQAQKQRKPSQHTWRLHNDATTWDEHIIEINLLQAATLGHIDLKFSLYQQCHNPAAIQVTLLKQNTSGFGYRMKGPHSSFKHPSSGVGGSNETPSGSNDGNNENPVLNEEFLQTHNAEILAGPIELSSCIDLCDQGGSVILTSPKLFKTRTRNFLLHIKTMGDPAKDGQCKTRGKKNLKTCLSLILLLQHGDCFCSTGCDWLHEISIYVRSVKTQAHIPNERLQRIAMLESNQLLDSLFKIISSEKSTTLMRNYALDILTWICCIRLKRFRSPKSERNKGQPILAQQLECICQAEKYLENTLRHCIIHSNRSMAHKCVKLMLMLTDGFCNLPANIKISSKLDIALRNAISTTFNELPFAKHASVVRWYVMLACITSTNKTYNSISEMCVKLLVDISEEIKRRWDPYGALIGTRFGLYGFPFEPDIFDYDLPNVNKNNVNFSSTLMNIIRNNAGLVQTAGIDIKKLCSIDGVDFRTFPHLIKCKSVSNQLRGLLEVEQLHFSCAATSEATRIDNMDTVSSSASTSNVNMDDLLIAPMVVETVDQMYSEKMNDIYNNVKNKANNMVDKIKFIKKLDGELVNLKPNGIGPIEVTADCLNANSTDKTVIEESASSKSKTGIVASAPTLPKFKFICEYIDQQLGSSTAKPPSEAKDEDKTSGDKSQSQSSQNDVAADGSSSTDNLNSNSTTVFPWHKLLSPPPKQMIVIDRMHSGARRFVVLDFGSPILLTDLIIPACDELASLHIDIWCFDEETDCVRLVVAPDIGTKTLVLSDIQPPPICRYMKITIMGRIGMSSTKCKIPLGSFFGHVIILESDGYGDLFMNYMSHKPQNIQAQLKALTSLHEDVHCRYSLASCKLLELLTPLLNSDVSNVAHMQAFINKQRSEDDTTMTVEGGKITLIYEECIVLQHEINVIRNVINRLESSLKPSSEENIENTFDTSHALRMASRDKLRVLGQALIEILLNFSIEYSIKDMMAMQQLFTADVANMLFNSFVVYGDAHIQLATCSLLVRMCCVQSWWGDFLANIFCTLFSSQNSKIFPQDRIFFLLTYLGRRSISMGNCRSIVIDAVLKTLAKQLAPISPRYQEATSSGLNMPNEETSASGSLCTKSDLQLITWLLLFLSVCLDDRKDKSANRWDFMSCETDFAKTRGQSSNSSGKQLRCFKKRIIQQNKYSAQPYTDWGKKIYMIQNEHPGIFMEITGKPKSSNKSSKSSMLPKPSKDTQQEPDNNFDKGLKNIRLNNILIVIRGLIALLLEMDFTCNMDQFLLTCKVIARLVSACRPAVQLSKIITINQLEHLIRMAVWNDQQQPWAVHAITCLLQDLLDADRHYKDNDATPTNDGQRTMDGFQETKDLFADYTSVKYPYLPSLIECEDTEFDDILNDIDVMERNKSVAKKDSSNMNKNTVNYFCKSISSAMDSRLDVGLDLNVETDLRRITMVSSLDMYSSLPQIAASEFKTTSPEVAVWPDYVADMWSGPEYNCGVNTYTMFKNVFDCILADLHLEETWVHLEQVLQMWLTLNGELADKPYNTGISNTDVPKIPFGANAIQGLLLALAWYNDVKLRTWCLGFQCLLLACNSQTFGQEDADRTRINEVIVNDENFEKMLLRFFSGYGMSSVIITNRCAGPTICKHLTELLHWLHRKGESTDGVISCKRKLKDTLLHVILQLIQPGGAISNQLGPIDAQSQLVRDLLTMPNDKADLNISLNIIECVSFLVFNNISNGDKLQCQRTSDTNNTGNAFSSLFANVLGSDHSKQNCPISDSSLIISLLRLCSSLIQTELPRQLIDVTIPEEEELTSVCQTDETKAEQLNIEGHRVKTPCIADTVLRHFPTMKRLLGSLSHCSSSSFTLMSPSDLYGTQPAITTFLLDEPQTAADAVFNMLLTLCEKASNSRLIVAPICQYLEACTSQRSTLPRLHLSEPLLWYISKVLYLTSSVQIFTQLGGIEIICKNLVKLNKILINVQPGLISMIMQHMTRNAKLKLVSHACANGNNKKSSSSSSQNHRYLQDGLINFAPFCTISAENDTAQSADILIMNPVASHRRPRTPAWSYMFYPNESHADLTITLPTAILLREVQLQPHAPTLASCPSAVALEISRDFGLGHVPVGPPLTTTGMTCIRLKLAKPEIATSIVLRLYRPKDSPSIGLTQIAVLGNTIFSPQNNNGGLVSNANCNASTLSSFEQAMDDDSFAKTSVGWVRILSRCYSVASSVPSFSKLYADVIGASAAYPGFLDACCSLMNIMPMIPNAAVQNLGSVLLQLGAYSRELCLQLIRTLLWNTSPQIYKLSNESICDLLYDLCTTKDAYVMDKVKVLLEWIDHLRQNFSSSSTARCNNPQSGFVKCIASILWHIYEDNSVTNLPELITENVFDACMHWIDRLENEEPLKVAFDSLLCSLCYIKPKFFNHMLLRLNVKIAHIADSSDVPNDPNSETTETKCGLTDDNKEISGKVWYANVAADNLSTMFAHPSYLATIALACQSSYAVFQLVDSGLPKLLAYALYEYCSNLILQEHNAQDARNAQQRSSPVDEALDETLSNTTSTTENALPSSCMTDADKVAGDQIEEMQTEQHDSRENQPPLMTFELVPKILDFFSECCAEGHMRDWLGTQQGSIFWKPLLKLLCNHRPIDFISNLPFAASSNEPTQQAFIRIERATINFFAHVTACHPNNQNILTMLLIEVIREPSVSLGASGGINADGSNKHTISGFTRQLVLQLLLENERILVSVRSKQPLQKRDPHTPFVPMTINLSSIASSNNYVPPSSVTISLVNHHPAKRINQHHLLFSVSTNTKCQEIIHNCLSENRRNDGSGVNNVIVAGPSLPNSTSCDILKEDGEKNQNDPYKDISINFNGLENGMEFLSVAAGVTAKDKRIKDAKNQVAANKENKKMVANFSEYINLEEILTGTSTTSSTGNCVQLVHRDYPDIQIGSDTSISQLLAALQSKGYSLAKPCLSLDMISGKGSQSEGCEETLTVKASSVEPLPSPLQRFSSRGGLSLLAQYLPTVYPEITSRKHQNNAPEKEKSPPMNDWVKLEPNDDIYEDLEDPLSEPTTKQATITAVPQHSLAAFGLFLRLPAYSDVLLRDKLRAQCLLRLVLGVTGDGEGNDIYSLSLAPTLPTLPFEVFRQLLDSSPLTTDDGMLLRRMVIEVGAMHLILNCLSIFTHHSPVYPLGSTQTEVANTSGSGSSGNGNANGNGNGNAIKPPLNVAEDAALATSDDKGHMYWAKGTGFGTGSTTQSWNVEQALLRQKSEEEHVTVLLQVLASYVNPGDRIPTAEEMPYHEIMNDSNELPNEFLSLLKQSCLIPALSSYLRNDSVLDITRHIPLYRAILQLLRSISLSQDLLSLLQPQNIGESSPSISELLTNMKTCVDTYAKRLKLNKKSNIKGQTQQVTVNIDDGDDEGLALLIPDIQETTVLVQKTTQRSGQHQQNQGNASGECGQGLDMDRPLQSKSIDDRYLEVMKKLQFDTFDMIVEAESNGYRFVVSHHFEKMVRMAGDRYHPSRVKRLAQEAVTLSTSLPLSFSSSVFVRCDTDRLDVMKVLITGPADTPYANGCFEFDVFFPPDYPNLPMLINLETTGRHSVRFNPNLYNDGKVCLSVLNTWHGRPEEKWNAQTSSFLQVLVSIQSLILVPEPYFNEPGFERSRGSPSGTHSSREYNSNIYQACVRWAMLEQIRNPSPCFKDVIHTHFWLKRNEICAQIENWIEELCKPQCNERSSRTISFNSMVLRRQYRHLREELAKLKVPEGLEDLDAPFNPNVTLPAMSESANNSSSNYGSGPAYNTSKPQTDASMVSTSTATSSSSGSGAIAETKSNPGSEETTVESLSSTLCSGSAPLAPLEINTNQPFISCTMDDDSDSPAVLPQSTLPAPVTAKVITVDETSNEADGEDGDEEEGDGDDIIVPDEDGDANDYKCNTVDDLMEQLFFDSSDNTMHYDD
ncbi:baculoviral IAP repeat-containing protein 6 isoform X2 [Stomoxys calcitrans]|uniref:baculoviral IAP repeat-containing protein 6 isoform X2 n=1 Tax=Stomoxys calcitrans TaxID=35570 RepID=UPI0027E2890C|nr:baculoviral IAP repeat-containing protein 6 isoform X2 [Stomoxys calcitrans]